MYRRKLEVLVRARKSSGLKWSKSMIRNFLPEIFRIQEKKMQYRKFDQSEQNQPVRVHTVLAQAGP
jgi:hypothetical protein